MTACSGEKFNVQGQITGAADSTLYFENMTLTGAVAVDSVKLDEKGTFSFFAERPATPEFFRLRIAGQMINVAIDSTETVGINADYATMATSYDVTGSENCSNIKDLAVLQLNLRNSVVAVEKSALSTEAKQDSILGMIDSYKKVVAAEYVYKDPRQSCAYFALFQTVGPYLIFNPYSNLEDMKAYAAVATCWDAFYPESERTKNLHNIAMQSVANIRAARAQAAEAERVAEDSESLQIEEAGLIDIELPDAKGELSRLSNLKGKVVMLDFHLFSMDVSPARIIMMRELYTKYHSRGLEIYQVSLDANEHFWKQQVTDLPWINVHDADGIRSIRLALYNVTSLPDYFLIDRGNNLVCRQAQVEDIEKEIEKLLRK